MITKPETQEEETETRTPFVPRIITGGKSSDPTDPNDWLSPLPEFTTILIQNKKDMSDFTLGQATIIHKFNKGRVLLFMSQAKEPVPVDPVRFCSKYRLYEVIQTVEEYSIEQRARQQVEEECMANGHHPSEVSPEVA